MEPTRSQLAERVPLAKRAATKATRASVDDGGGLTQTTANDYWT